MKLSAAFGDTKELRTKSFELGNHKFKVRVPLTKELEDMTARCEAVDEAKFATRYSKATAGFKEGDGVEIKEDDVIVDGSEVAIADAFEHSSVDERNNSIDRD